MKTLFIALILLTSIALAQTDIAISTATGGQRSPNLAAGDSCFFVVWEDSRSGTTNYNVFGQTVFADSSTGFGYAVGIAPGNQTKPVIVALDESNYLSIWYDQRSDFEFYSRNCNCSGTPALESFIGDAPSNISNPQIAISDDIIIMVWATRISGIFHTEYIVLDDSGTPITSASELAGDGTVNPDIAFNGTEFLAVWQDDSSDIGSIKGRKFDTSGSPIGTEFVITEDTVGLKPSVCAIPGSTPSESDFAVAWEHRAWLEDGQIWAQKLEDPSATVITDSPYDKSAPEIGYHGTGFFLIWEQENDFSVNDIYGAYISEYLSPVDTAFVVCDADFSQEDPALAYSQAMNLYLAVWTDWRSTSFSDLYGNLFQPPVPLIVVNVDFVYPADEVFSACDSSIYIRFNSDFPIDSTTYDLTFNGTSIPPLPSGFSIDFEDYALIISPDFTSTISDSVEICLEDIQDISGNHLEAPYCWEWYRDVNPPSITHIAPSPGTILDDTFTISIEFSDDLSGIDASQCTVQIDDIELAITDPRVGFDGSNIEIDISGFGLDIIGGDSIDICLHLTDLTTLCGPNVSDSCWQIHIASGGPIASIIEPFDSAFSACSDQSISVEITDMTGVDESTIELMVNGSSYTTSSPELLWADPIITLEPVSFWTSGPVHVQLISASDILGNVLETSLEWTFYIDIDPPEISDCYPDTTVFTDTPQIGMVLTDTLSGIDLSSLYLIVDGVSYTCGSPGISWDGTNLLFNSSDVGLSFTTGESISVEIIVSDYPDYCSANVSDTSWSFFVESDDIDETTSKPENLFIRTVPNPFNSQVKIITNIGATVFIYDIHGNRVCKPFTMADNNFIWQPPSRLGSGVYFLCVNINNQQEISRLIYLK